MTYDRTDRIRRAAILVASLDAPLAEQILSELPAAQAARVLNLAEEFDWIDPEEQQDVLAEFRRLSRSAPASTSAVEFAYSSESGNAGGSEPPAATVGQAANDELNAGDVAAMAELLTAEHPQIVAAALTRLSEEQGAAVFAALPGDLQSDVIERLSALAPADADAVQVVESQLQQRLVERRAHQARSAAGAELVRRILARTPDSQRTYLLQRMAMKEAPVSAPPGQPIAARSARPSGGPAMAAIDPVAQQAFNLASAVRRAQAGPLPEPPQLREDRTADLELLDDEDLVAALRAADEPTVLRALAASGDAFLARVTNMLPRRQAKQLHRLLRNLGPTRLADLHRAQHELLRLAEQFSDAPVEAAA